LYDIVENLVDQVALLCGRQFDNRRKTDVINKLRPIFGDKENIETFTYRQLNEILLLCNERIVTKEFFAFLANLKSLKSKPSKKVSRISFNDFKHRVNEFRKLAMLHFGSFRYAFNYLCRRKDIDTDMDFGVWTRDHRIMERNLKDRPDSILEITDIDENELHLLGYVSGGAKESAREKKAKQTAEQNFKVYLTYDYLDVYVATSMREKWEYVEVNKLCNEIFTKTKLKNYNVRYFNPTQNYHSNSIAKSLIEGLMLKRAKCTLYLVQERDTMGKDSEMASTLAQGKPVIAYVPDVDVSMRVKRLQDASIDEILKRANFLKQELSNGEEGEEFKDLIELIGVKTIAASSQQEQKEILKQHKEDFKRLIEMLAGYEKRFFNNRASVLMKKHPLRFQIDLKTGVANGVLVARSAKICSELILGILTNNLDFDIIEPEQKSDLTDEIDDLNYRLIESKTKCSFRVVTRDEMLTNSFWNLYNLGEN